MQVYSGALKHSLNLNQDDLDSIATYPYIAGLFTWIPGLLNDRIGPRLTTMIGSGGMALTLALYWMVATRRVDWDPVVSLVAIGFGVTLFNGAITGAPSPDDSRSATPPVQSVDPPLQSVDQPLLSDTPPRGAPGLLDPPPLTFADASGPVFCSIVKNFPMERGAVVGIAKAWVGLCGGILTQLYIGFVGKPDDSKATLNFVLEKNGEIFNLKR